MVFGQTGEEERERKPGDIVFHPLRAEEYNLPQQYGFQFPQQLGVRPRYKDYACGACGSANSGRVICDLIRASDGATVSWCVCSCERREPTVFIEKDGTVISQLPTAREFHANKHWPPDLSALYEEAARSYCGGAYTAAAMVCRKLLMACACYEQSEANQIPKDGLPFTEYVDYIVDTAIPFPRAKTAIDSIRTIGNDANHKVTFVTQTDAERAMRIVTYTLDTLYTLPQS